jgi:hypothetical protein
VSSSVVGTTIWSQHQNRRAETITPARYLSLIPSGLGALLILPECGVTAA